ncbi:serine/threonine-protein kinase [Cumulibacter manganitolerans]|uniref:serine/threonine-protein kinase n=1 Tax=Cumulibacter manganitolerans TaxID=1884992 RepID=UPI001295F281|nr:serine/threonine-protein kinase [Cumulibacter manganitolerans]
MPDEPLPSTRADSAETVLAGRYRLGGLLGRGGMAEVYAATDELLHRPVAVKLFRADGLDGNERRRIDAEIHLLAGLRHPGLVTVFDAGVLARDAGTATPFLVMELIHGPTLRHRLADGALPRETVAHLGEELAATLAYVHAQGVVHRDVKPANILLDDEAHGPRSYTAKLTDFGIARLVEATRLTAVGMTIGTANYVSPEQATGKVTGAASDVYSLGLVLLECLTGQVAFPGAGVEAALARLARQPSVPSDLGADWTRLLVAMTDADPSGRPTADRVAQALAAIGAEGGPPSIAGAGGPAETDVPTVAAVRPADAGAPTVALTGLPGIGSSAPAVAGAADVAEPASATKVLGHDEAAADGTVQLRRRRTPRLSSRPRWLPAAVVAAAVLAVVLAVVLLSTARDGSSGSSSPTSPPSYPTVPGPIGTHLRQLEEAVG